MYIYVCVNSDRTFALIQNKLNNETQGALIKGLIRWRNIGNCEKMFTSEENDVSILSFYIVQYLHFLLSRIQVGLHK